VHENQQIFETVSVRHEASLSCDHALQRVRASGYSGFSYNRRMPSPFERDLIDFQIAAMSAYPHVAYQRLCSASVGGALLGLCLRGSHGLRRQLQHGRDLSGDQSCDHHDLAAREFERVVVDVRIVHIYLPEPCDLVIHARFPEKAARAIVLDVVLERQFRAGK